MTGALSFVHSYTASAEGSQQILLIEWLIVLFKYLTCPQDKLKPHSKRDSECISNLSPSVKIDCLNNLCLSSTLPKRKKTLSVHPGRFCRTSTLQMKWKTQSPRKYFSFLIQQMILFSQTIKNILLLYWLIFCRDLCVCACIIKEPRNISWLCVSIPCGCSESFYIYDW